VTEDGENSLGELVQLVHDDAGAVGAPRDQVLVPGVAEEDEKLARKHTLLPPALLIQLSRLHGRQLSNVE
jgi:hypothetical protein